jgi:hypothetical protein
MSVVEISVLAVLAVLVVAYWLRRRKRLKT